MTGLLTDRHRAAVCLGLLALLMVAWWLFRPALSGPFVFDDFPNLENLRQIGGAPTLDAIRVYLASAGGNPGRPLAMLSFLIEDSAWPAYPADFKRDNLLLHLIVGLLVFALARALAARSRMDTRRGDWMALACSAMWLLHPMQLSATMLVVQRMNILSSLFMLLGLLAYLRVLAEPRLSEFTRVALAGTALAVFGALAFLCKENGILIFAYATALNLTVLRESIALYATRHRRLLLLGAAAPLVVLALGAAANFDAINAVYRIRDFTMGERLLTEARILIEYLRVILLPRVGGLSIFHDDYAVSRDLLHPPTTLLAILAIAALLGSALALRRRAPVYAFAVLWFFAGHLLESTVVSLELYFEHRNYLPMFGPLFALTYLVFSIRPPWRRLAQGLLALWLVTCSWLTWASAGVWGDRGLLANVWLAENPGSARAVQMVASYKNDRGDYTGAAQVLDEGIRRNPAAKELVFQRALLDCFYVGISPGRWQSVIDAARTAPRSAGIPENVAVMSQQSLQPGGCHGSLKRADIDRLMTQLMRNPAIAGDANAMGFLHYELSKQALHDHDLDRLMFHLDESYRYRPSPFVPREQAIYLLSAGLPAEALKYLDISDGTKQPLIKKLLLDMPARNQSLRRSALGMIETQSKAARR